VAQPECGTPRTPHLVRTIKQRDGHAELKLAMANFLRSEVGSGTCLVPGARRRRRMALYRAVGQPADPKREPRGESSSSSRRRRPVLHVNVGHGQLLDKCPAAQFLFGALPSHKPLMFQLM
jgi:hypothetical protein